MLRIDQRGLETVPQKLNTLAAHPEKLDLVPRTPWLLTGDLTVFSGLLKHILHAVQIFMHAGKTPKHIN